MNYDTYFLHYGTIALAVAINSVGVGLGEGMTSLAALKAINIQPSASNEISRTFLLGMALIETSAIIGLTMALLMFNTVTGNVGNLSYIHYAEIGIAASICLTGFVVGIASSFPARYACLSVARQPFFSQKIQTLMLLTQSLMQTPIIFAFIIALLIKLQLHATLSLVDSFRLIASGLCIGIGSIGPSIGLAIFSKEVCKSAGVNREAYPKILSFTLLSEAIIESPIIFTLLVSIILLTTKVKPTDTLASGIAFLAASICIGLTTFGAGISSGRVSGQACKEIALQPEYYPIFAKLSLIAQALIETSAIYGLIIAMALIFVR